MTLSAQLDAGQAATTPGGSGLVRLARIVETPIDEDAIWQAVSADENGAICVFRGVVRNHDHGLNVVRLDYSAHPEAERLLASLCEEVATQTGIALAAAHRVGTLTVGDTALCAAAGSGHRAEAFDACRILVERIKHEIPIWKRQHGTDGTTEWVGL